VSGIAALALVAYKSGRADEAGAGFENGFEEFVAVESIYIFLWVDLAVEYRVVDLLLFLVRYR
jgi:hypothetical protein